MKLDNWIQDNRGQTVFTYEPGSDRVSSITDPVTGTVAYTYLLTGERLNMTLPGGGTWNYTYFPNAMLKDDPNSLSLRLSNIIDDQGRRIDFLMDPAGPLESVRTNETYTMGSNPQLSSYQETDYTYQVNASGILRERLMQVKTTWNYVDASNVWHQSVLSQNVYGYDTLGQRLSNQITDSTGAVRTESYAYDALNRLTAVNYGDGETQGDPTNPTTNPGYTFDPMGNRVSKQDSVTGAENYGYNNANMLISRVVGGNSQSYTNDLDGNTLTGGGRTNAWDSENRLSQCVYTSNGTTNSSVYTYGADGLRRRAAITAESTTTTTDFVLDNSMFVRELRSNAGVAYNYATYLAGPRGPEYRRDDVGQTVRWYVYDGLGSVLAEVDPNGNVTASRKYDVYGGVRSSTGTSTSKHKFVGALGHPSDDESGLIYMRARYMDPQLGRFISEDPGTSGSNWLIYAGNDPINKVDRNGRISAELAQALMEFYRYLQTGEAQYDLAERLYQLDCKYNGAVSRFLTKVLGEDGMNQFWSQLYGKLGASTETAADADVNTTIVATEMQEQADAQQAIDAVTKGVQTDEDAHDAFEDEE